MTLTCKDPNPPGVFRQADGGYVETSHGWFYNAQLTGFKPVSDDQAIGR
jgi:hypothetical protein